MRVLLLQPLVNFEKTFPLGLAYIAGYLRRHGVEVHGFDARVSGMDALPDLLRREPFDLVAITAYSSNLPDVAACAAQVARIQPGATLVMGGPHATLGLEPQGPPDMWHYMVRGDGEAPLLALCRGETDAPGLVPAGQPMDDPEQIYLHPDLADLDFPDREVFPVAEFYTGALKQEVLTAVIASRGCPCRCAYCAASALSRGDRRRREPAAVVEEIHRLKTDHNVGQVLLEDDNIFLDRRWASDLLGALARARHGVNIDLPNGVDPMLLDSELLHLARDAGVCSISLGVESLIPDNQRAMGRVIDPDHLRWVIQACHGLGIRIAAFFIIGLPFDTVPGILRQYRDIRRLGLDLAHVSVYQHLPGLGLQVSPPSPSEAKTLSRLHRLFYPYFYADPTKIMKVLRDSGSSPEMLKKTVVRFRNWVARSPSAG